MNREDIKKIIKVPTLLLRAGLNPFGKKGFDHDEEQKVEERAQKMIRITQLLDQRKFIPHGPAYSKLPDSNDQP